MKHKWNGILFPIEIFSFFAGIESDFDGRGGLADCADVSDYPKITAELVKRGYSQEEISKIWGGNFLRVFREVEHCTQ